MLCTRTPKKESRLPSKNPTTKTATYQRNNAPKKKTKSEKKNRGEREQENEERAEERGRDMYTHEVKSELNLQAAGRRS